MGWKCHDELIIMVRLSGMKGVATHPGRTLFYVAPGSRGRSNAAQRSLAELGSIGRAALIYSLIKTSENHKTGAN